MGLGFRSIFVCSLKIRTLQGSPYIVIGVVISVTGAT